MVFWEGEREGGMKGVNTIFLEQEKVGISTSNTLYFQYPEYHSHNI